MEGADDIMKYDIISIGCLSFDTLIKIPFMPKVNSECFINQMRYVHGGSAANVAAYSAFYGDLRVGLVSKIGFDEIGEELLTRMKEYGVDDKGVSRQKNSLSTRIIAIQYPGGGRTYLVYLGALEELSAKDIPNDYIFNSTVFYIAPSTPQIHEEFINIAIDHGKLIALNPGSVYLQENSLTKLYQFLKFVDFLFVNEQEALHYSNEETIKAAGFTLQRSGAKHVIITCGDLGCYVFSQKGSKFFSSHKTEDMCSIGAGDAFAAGFLVEFLKTGDIESAAQMGNFFGAFGIKHSELRKENPDKEEFLKFL